MKAAAHNTVEFYIEGISIRRGKNVKKTEKKFGT
jgi:hypothetical protein